MCLGDSGAPRIVRRQPPVRAGGLRTGRALGMDPGRSSGARGCDPTRARSNSTPRMSRAAMPSATTWCIRISRAMLSSPLPVSTHISHSVRDRSSGASFSSAHTFSRDASSAGKPRSRDRTWLAMSNAGSSTQIGGPAPNGAGCSRWRRRGARRVRAWTCSRIFFSASVHRSHWHRRQKRARPRASARRGPQLEGCWCPRGSTGRGKCWRGGAGPGSRA